MESREWIVTAVKLIFVFAGVIALIAFVVVPLWRMLRTGPDPTVLNPFANLPSAEEKTELEIPVGGDPRKLDRAALIEMAKKDPRAAARFVSELLREKK